MVRGVIQLPLLRCTRLAVRSWLGMADLCRRGESDGLTFARKAQCDERVAATRRRSTWLTMPSVSQPR